MPSVRDLLAEKRTGVVSVSPDCEVLEAVRVMNQHRIGALVVANEGRVVGMFTERDVLRLVGALQDLGHLRVGDVMSREVVIVAPETELDDIAETMKLRRVRHIPVVQEGGPICGMVSIGDLNAWSVEHQARQLQGLNEYIYGRC